MSSAVLIWTIFPKQRPPEPAIRLVEDFGKFKIVMLSIATAGPLGGPSYGQLATITGAHCIDRVAVLPGTVDDKQAVDERYRVFEAKCASFADHSTSPKTEWMPDLIIASINNSAKDGETLLMRKTDASGTIRIQFEAHE